MGTSRFDRGTSAGANGDLAKASPAPRPPERPGREVPAGTARGPLGHLVRSSPEVRKSRRRDRDDVCRRGRGSSSHQRVFLKRTART
jgi:hypothetical protein